MTMGVSGYRFKSDLKKAVGTPLNYVETSMFGPEYTPNGTVVVVGPDAYSKRDWFAEVTLKDGLIVKVK